MKEHDNTVKTHELYVRGKDGIWRVETRQTFGTVEVDFTIKKPAIDHALLDRLGIEPCTIERL